MRRLITLATAAAILFPVTAFAQGTGTSLATAAGNIISEIGGQTGAKLAGAAFIVCCVLAGLHVISPRSAVTVVVLFTMAWCTGYIINTVIGWS